MSKNITPEKILCRCGCGKYLTPNLEREMVPSKITNMMLPKGTVTKINGYGYMNNGYFQTLRCGFRWALHNLNNKT